ncbi:MAG: 2-oxoacid:acceptor oxidoreductase family protein [Chloroflexi bacterium]|nr:2-oxoacid:acceptor oxidoreductase family protein [Chloroflexota bacterium]
MKEIRIHARAGQGAITAALLLASAAFLEGKYSLAFPHFGAERTGAPMNAYARLSDAPIRLRTQVRRPDYVLVQDPTLIASQDVAEGLKDGGIIVVNSDHPRHDIRLKGKGQIFHVPAARIAQEELGRADRANAPLLGAFAAATGEVKLESLQKAVRSRFPGPAGEANARAIQRAYEFIKNHALVAEGDTR